MKSEMDLSGMKNIMEIPMLMADYRIHKAFPENRRLMLFLDYDGTLSPIVSAPENAVLYPFMKQALEKCASMYTVGIISGRDTDDVINRVGIEGIIYAGNHGLTIQGPGNLIMEHDKAHEALQTLSEIEEKLMAAFSAGPSGVQIERKKYAITVHYRNVRAEEKGFIKKKTESIVSGYSGIKKEKGKKIIEIKPDINWNKGLALKWIMDKMGKWKDPAIYPVFIGDDITDEDAFKMIRGKGAGVIVGLHDNEYTHADYRLKDVNEVREFLEILSATR